MIYIPYPRVNCLKTIPFKVAHTYIAHIWQYLPPGPQVIETSIRTILCGRFYFAVGFKNKSQGEEVFLCSVMFN